MDAREPLALGGSWRLRDETGELDLPMTLPGDVHSALLAADLIPDPYVGRHEHAVRWVAERDWVLTREIELERVPEAALLTLDGVDTVAVVSVNGHEAMRPENGFRPWHARLGADVLREGANAIEIRLLSPVREAARRHAEQPYPVPHLAKICPIAHGNMLRKPQCDFGWDWNPALAPLGVYGEMSLAPSPERVGPPLVTQRHHADGRVEVRVRAALSGFAGEVDCELRLGPARARARVAPGEGLDATLALHAPALWWPRGHGEQPLHGLEIDVGTHRVSLRLALRDVELVSETSEGGRSFTVRVNGTDVFCRGASWVPAEALPGRITDAATRELLVSAAEANMNMVRAWGGGRYEPDAFYEACDELGLLVWQDYMFACNLYPATDAFLDEVEAEVEHQTRRLAHRVALWCGDNELIGALGWFEESRRDRDRYLVAYDRLNRRIESTLRRLHPQASWWPSSPSPGPLDFGDAWHDDRSGDMHFWSVWHEGRDFEHYRDVRPRFCSEFGFQSFPSMDVVRRFAGPDDLNASSPVMDSHQKDPGGNARIASTMFRYFRFPLDFESFVWLSQVQQAEAVRTAVTWWRTLAPHCMGALIWQLNDAWPGASWSSLDHGGGWKLLHHAARRFFAPVTVAAVPGAHGRLALTGINDTRAAQPVRCELLRIGPDGEAREVAHAAVELAPGERRALGEAGAGDGREALVLRLTTEGGGTSTELAAPERFKEIALVDPALRVEVVRTGRDAVELEVSAGALALFVTLHASVPGRFSDNLFPLWPGAPRTVRFVPRDPTRATEARFSSRHLHGTTGNGRR